MTTMTTNPHVHYAVQAAGRVWLDSSHHVWRSTHHLAGILFNTDSVEDARRLRDHSQAKADGFRYAAHSQRCNGHHDQSTLEMWAAPWQQ